MLIFSLALAQAAPLPLTETHQRDIGCVAVIAILAGEQDRGVPDAKAFKDVRQAGKDWMPIVGERIMQETGQPRELVGFAMTEAAKAEQARFADGAGSEKAKGRIEECLSAMYIDLGKAVIEADMAAHPVAADAYLSGVDWGTDEPALLARYKAELAADMKDRARIFHCYQITNAAYAEIVKREGYNSRDAEAMFVLPAGLSWWTGELPLPPPGSPPLKPAVIDADKEQDFARCVRLGQAAYAKMPKPTTQSQQ